MKSCFYPLANKILIQKHKQSNFHFWCSYLCCTLKCYPYNRDLLSMKYNTWIAILDYVVRIWPVPFFWRENIQRKFPSKFWVLLAVSSAVNRWKLLDVKQFYNYPLHRNLLEKHYIKCSCSWPIWSVFCFNLR